MKQTTIVAIVLGLLIVISTVQAFQLSSLKTKVAEDQVSLGSSSSSSSSGSSGRSVALPASVTELPQMVGGC